MSGGTGWADLLGVHYGSHSHCQSHGRNLGEVVAKETSVRHDGVLRQSFNSGPGNEAGAGFVEGNVAIRANSCEEGMRDSRHRMST